MTSFERRYPNKGIRQPRIQYRVDAPRFAILEDLREWGGFRNMNGVYLEALVIGAAVLLAKARAQGFELSDETTPTLPAHGEFFLPVPPRTMEPPRSSAALSAGVVAPPVAADPGMSDIEKDLDAKLSVVVEPVLRVPPLELPRLGIPPRPSISAADAQFSRFGEAD